MVAEVAVLPMISTFLCYAPSLNGVNCKMRMKATKKMKKKSMNKRVVKLNLKMIKKLEMRMSMIRPL